MRPESDTPGSLTRAGYEIGRLADVFPAGPAQAEMIDDRKEWLGD